MKYIPIDETEYALFHELLNAYYRDGEDADTPQTEIDGFIQLLFDLCTRERISGCIAWEDAPMGFVLWNIDTPDGVFSNKPGYGTILEIGVSQAYRGRGIGGQLAAYAESQMAVEEYYVCAYGPAERFWQKCGYHDSGEIAENGLKLFVKTVSEN